MKSSPIGGIFAIKMSPEKRYADTVLESLAVLDTTKDIFLKQNNIYINQTFLTKHFLNILNIIHNSPNDACSLDLINTYFELAKNINNNEALFPIPYNFLTFFLSFLDEVYRKINQLILFKI